MWSSHERNSVGRWMVTRMAAGKSGRNELARKVRASTPPADVPMARTSRLAMPYSAAPRPRGETTRGTERFPANRDLRPTSWLLSSGIVAGEAAALSGYHSPAAGVALEHGRMQSKRFWREAADPKLYALNLDLNEDCVYSVRLGRKIGVIGALPALADLGCLLVQGRCADQRDVDVVGFALKDDGDLTGAPYVGHLVRTTIGDELDR